MPKKISITFLKSSSFYLSFWYYKSAPLTSPSGRNFYLKTEGRKWHVSFCLIFLTCCCQICWGNIFCSSNYWKRQQPRGCSKLNVLLKQSMPIPSAPQVHKKYLRHSCCQLTTFWTHWAIFEFTTVYDAKRNRTEEVFQFVKLEKIRLQSKNTKV